MAKEASVAPRERVNITYKPATGDAKEEVELPFKMVVLGDFTMRADDRPLEERKPIRVDKDNFNEVLKKQNLSLDINVEDRLSGNEDSELGLSLKFGALKDFAPESVAEQVPELNKLLELRKALQALKGPLGNLPAFRKKLQEILKTETDVDRILKELGSGSPDEAKKE
ncbi:MAG TPA: type VI secretion system contractile sheath small subunit [Candidatus Polarisedimenticolia bacterium]|nr:type VI secretion system contractile sheath small subunit [Candidatus Polarisedimenticolia bacterium]